MWLSAPAGSLPHLVSQGIMDPFPRAVDAPELDVVIDRLPGREVMGQEPPGTAGPDDIANRIEDLSPIPGRTTTGLGRRNQGESSAHSASVRSVA